MRIFSEFEDYFNTPIRRSIGLFLTVCFFLSMVFLAIHHHDAFFPLKNCAICKAKTSSSGAFSKVEGNFAPIVAVVNHRSQEIDFTLFQIRSYHQRSFISSFLHNPFLNKAPPMIA